MQLLYLWVKEYRNIGKIDFNFSPEFSFGFTEQEPKLFLKKTSSRIDKKIFPKNLDFTAIVGRNGCGKSSIVKLFEELFYNKQSIKNMIIVYKINRKLYYYSNIKKIKVPSRCQKSSFLDFEFISYISENPYPTMNRLNYHVSNYDEIEDKNFRTVTFDTKFIVFSSLKLLDEIKLTSFMLRPEKIIINSININFFFYHILNSLKSDLLLQSLETLIDYIKSNNIEVNILFKLDDIIISNYEEKFIKFILDENNKKTKKHQIDDEEFENEIFNEEFENNFSIDFDSYQFITLIELFHSKYKLTFHNYLDRFYDILKSGFFNISKESTVIRDKFLITYLEYIDYDFEDANGHKFHDLSHGQKSMYGQMINLLYKIDLSPEKNFLFFLDEPDLSLHPEWQQNFLSEFINLFSGRTQNIHLVFTTHSPFLISDLPKKNIIFLDKDEENNIQIIDGLKDKEQTFGANIHTLLSDSFFMDDLMGAFAKNEIQKVISFLNSNKTNLKMKNITKSIINVIGEPFLKDKLLDMYNDKFKVSNQEYNADIDMQIKYLESLKKPF